MKVSGAKPVSFLKHNLITESSNYWFEVPSHKVKFVNDLLREAWAGKFHAKENKFYFSSKNLCKEVKGDLQNLGVKITSSSV